MTKTRKEKAAAIAKDAICEVAKNAWGIDQQALESPSQQHPLAFQRAVCILAMHDEFGIDKGLACRSFGKIGSNFVALRRSATKWLDRDTICRDMASDFLAALDAKIASVLEAA